MGNRGQFNSGFDFEVILLFVMYSLKGLARWLALGQKRDSVQARMRNLVRRLLRRWKYPPDAAEEAIKLVLEQAEVLADGWYK